jgi:hypothetical protein
MSVPSIRTMPTIRTAWGARGYRLDLPGGITRYAMDRQEARAIVARELPFTSLDFVGDPPTRPNQTAVYLERMHAGAGHTDPVGACRVCDDMHEEVAAAGLPD